jgi:hypothetical protein
MEIEAMRNPTTEYIPGTSEAIDDEVAAVASDVAKMRGDTGVRGRAIVAIADEIAKAGWEIAAAEGRTGRRVETCGLEVMVVSTALVAAMADNELARSIVGAAFEHATGKRVVHVCYRWSGSPLLDDRFLVCWHDGVPAGWWTIPIPYRMCSRRRGSVRRDVRNWLNSNTRRGTVMVVRRWDMEQLEDNYLPGIVPAVAFEDQEDAALFRLCWL